MSGVMTSSLIVSVLVIARDLFSGTLRTLGLSLTGLQGMMIKTAIGIGAAIAGVGIVSAKLASDFDQSMHRIGALTATSAAQMEEYKNRILAMAPQLDQAPKALADGLYFVISAGYSGSKALEILTLSAKAAASTFTPMESVADLLTTSMNSYRNANLSAGHAMDDLITLIVNGKITMHSLATSFGFVAVQAANAGLSFDEAAAAVSNISQISGEHGARRVMLEFSNALRQLGPNMEMLSQKAMKMKGLKEPWDAAKFAAMSFIEKLRYIATETGGVGYLDKTQAAAYMATGNLKNLAQATAHANRNFLELVGGAAAFLPIAMVLSDKGKQYDTILKQMGGSGEKTAHAFDVMRQSTGQQMKMFMTTLETLGVELGLHLLPAINVVLTALRGFGQSIIGWLGAPAHFAQLAQAVKGVGIVILAILTPAILGAVAAALPWLAIIAAIIGAGILVGKAFDALTSHWKQFTTFIGGNTWQAWALKSALIAIAIALGIVLVNALLALIPVAVTWIGLMATGIAMTAIAAAPLIAMVAGIALVVFAIAMLITHWKQVVNFLHGVWQGIIHIVQAGVQWVISIVRRFVEGLVLAFLWLYQHNTYFKALVDFIIAVFTFLKAFVTKLWTDITTWLHQQWQKIVVLAKVAWQQVYQHVIQPVQRIWNDVMAVLGGFWTKISGWFGNLASKALDWGKNMIHMFVNGIKAAAGELWDTVSGIGKNIAGFLGFHSPPPKGPLADSHLWMPNMMKMFGSGILSGTPALTLAAQHAAGALARSLSGISSSASSGRAATLAGAGLAGGGGGDTHIHAIFPNVTSANELKKAFNDLAAQRERATYHKARQAGYGRGLRAGV